MKKIQRPDAGTLLTEHFRLTSRVSPQLEEFIIPTAQVSDLSIGATPPTCRSGAMQFSNSPVVGERSVWRFESPPGVICKIKRFWCLNVDVDGDLTAHFGSSLAVVPTVAATSRFTDGRLTGLEPPAGLVLHDTQVGLLAAFEWRRFIPLLTDITIEPNNWVAGTGRRGEFGFIEFLLTGVASSVNVSMEWDEFTVV